MTRIIVVLLTLTLFGCQVVEHEGEYTASTNTKPRQQDSMSDKTVTHVVWYSNETDRESVKRWLKNLLSNRKIKYNTQLEAARLFLMLKDSSCEGE